MPWEAGKTPFFSHDRPECPSFLAPRLIVWKQQPRDWRPSCFPIYLARFAAVFPASRPFPFIRRTLHLLPAAPGDWCLAPLTTAG